MRKIFFIIPNFNQTITGGTTYDLNLFKDLKSRFLPIQKIFVDINSKYTNFQIFSRISNLPFGSTLCIDGLLTSTLKNNIDFLCQNFNIIFLIHHPITQENNFSPFSNLKDYFSERIVLNKKLKIITVSNFIKKELQRYLNKFKKVSVAEPGVEDIFFSDYQYKNTNNILSIGNVIPRKGYHILIDALSKVPSNWNLSIIGDYNVDKKYYKTLTSKIKKFNLNDRIRFLGTITQRQVLYHLRNSKLFVLPTLFEGYGMSLLEATIMGLKVITTDLPVLRESLKGKNVQFIDYCKTNDFSLAIEENLKLKPTVIKNKDKYSYSWAQTGKKFLEALNEQ